MGEIFQAICLILFILIAVVWLIVIMFRGLLRFIDEVGSDDCGERPIHGPRGNPGHLPNSPQGDGEENWKKTPGYRGNGIY